MRGNRARRGRVWGACIGAIVIGGVFLLGACLQPIGGVPGYELITREDYSIIFGFLFAFIVAAAIGGGLGYWLGGRIVEQRAAVQNARAEAGFAPIAGAPSQSADDPPVVEEGRTALTQAPALQDEMVPAPATKVYRNSKWGLALPLPADWEVVWENEPDGGWEIIVGVAGRPSAMGRPIVTVRLLPHEVINFRGDNVAVFAAGGPGASAELPRSVQEYHEMCRRELLDALLGVEFISEQTGRLAGMPAGILVYSYPAGEGFIRETQVNLFGRDRTYRLMCEAPTDRPEEAEAYFSEVLAGFAPVAGT